MNADILTTRVADGIAVITLGSARRIYFDEEMGDALTARATDFRSRCLVGVRALTELGFAVAFQPMSGPPERN